MTLKSSSYKRGSIFNVRISGENFENVLNTNYFNALSRFFVYDKIIIATFIMAVFAQVGEMTHLPLVFLLVQSGK